MTLDQTINLTDIAKSWGMTDRDGELFYGRVKGFPVGFQVIDPQTLPLLLFQVRHPLAADAAELKAIRYGNEVMRMMADKKVEIEFDRQIAWITFVDAFDLLQRGEVKRVLDDILNSFSAAGLAKSPELCHYCQKERVDELSCRDGKVLQICPRCLEERTAPEKPAQTSSSNIEVMPVVALGALTALVGAGGWCICWGVYEIFTGDSNVIFLKVEALVAVGAGAVAGCPSGLLIRKMRKTGSPLYLVLAGICGLTAAIVGEAFFVAWLIYREYHVISLVDAFKALPNVEMAMDRFRVVTKVLAVFIALAFSIGLAKAVPKAAKETL
jgi:hypothetical protein